MKILLASGWAMLSFAFFQLPATPPMKMGLWESSSTITMKMPDMPMAMPGMGAPRTTKVRSCITPENYAKNLATSQQQKSCTRSNEVWTGSKYTADITCPSSSGKGHIEMNFDSKEGMHGTSHMDMSPGGRSMTMDMTIESHFIGADCGSVSPDKAEIIK